MSEEINSVNPESEIPVSEQLARQYTDLGEAMVDLARDKVGLPTVADEHRASMTIPYEKLEKYHDKLNLKKDKMRPAEEVRRDIDATSTLQRLLNPDNWGNRKWAERYDSVEQRIDALKQEAMAYLPEIHAEALDYAKAYEAYMDAREALIADVGEVDDIWRKDRELNMREFIETIDRTIGKYGGKAFINYNKRGAATSYMGGQWTKGVEPIPENSEERTRFFEKRAKSFAITQILTPRLPTETESVTYNTGIDATRPETWGRKTEEYGYSNLPGIDYYRTDKEARFPRLDVSIDDETMRRIAERDGKDALEVSVTVNVALQEPSTERRYIPVSTKVTELLQSIDSRVEGRADLLGRSTNWMRNEIWSPVGKVEYEITPLPKDEILSTRKVA